MKTRSERRTGIESQAVARLPFIVVLLGLIGTGANAEIGIEARAEPNGLPPKYAVSPGGKPLTQEDYASLNEGGIIAHHADILGSPVKKSTAIALIDAPPEAVFTVLTDYEDFPQFMPFTKKVTVHQEEKRLCVRYDLDLPWPIGDRHYVVEMDDGREEIAGTPVMHSRWTYQPGSGNIRDTFGSWEILPYGEAKSFVRYTVFTDPGGRIPKWARRMAPKIAVPRVIKGLRKRVKKTLAEEAKRASSAPANR